MQPIFPAGELWRHKSGIDTLCYRVHVVTAGNSAENGYFLTDDSLEYSDLSHLSVISNELSIEEETIENPLGVLPYQFELEFDSRTVSLGGRGGG